MKNIRVTAGIGPFVRGQRGIQLHEDDKSVWMKGRYLVGPECLTKNLNGTVGPGDVVYGPIPKEFIEEYVPEPPEPTMKEKIKAIWPPDTDWFSTVQKAADDLGKSSREGKL